MVQLCRTDRMISILQVLKEGGENNLHSHTHYDGFWMVLGGRARFWGEGEKLIAELGKNEGVLIPRGCPYWFEAAGDEDLELLQVEAFDISVPNREDIGKDRIDYEPQKDHIAR